MKMDLSDVQADSLGLVEAAEARLLELVSEQEHNGALHFRLAEFTRRRGSLALAAARYKTARGLLDPSHQLHGPCSNRIAALAGDSFKGGAGENPERFLVFRDLLTEDELAHLWRQVSAVNREFSSAQTERGISSWRKAQTFDGDEDSIGEAIGTKVTEYLPSAFEQLMITPFD